MPIAKALKRESVIIRFMLQARHFAENAAPALGVIHSASVI
jgi:hypothetical protein